MTKPSLSLLVSGLVVTAAVPDIYLPGNARYREVRTFVAGKK